jgi:putative membrane protein
MGRRIIAALHLEGVHRIVARPIVAAILSNVILIVTHSPIAVDTLRASQFGSFALDMIWLVSGFILWTPIISPLPEARASSAPIKLVYLFAAAALMPMIPGGFLTFASQPLYSTYELAPRLAGIDALNDQQTAGVLMKVGNLPVIWTVMAVIWFRWYKRESDPAGRAIVRDPVTGAPLRRPPATTASR